MSGSREANHLYQGSGFKERRALSGEGEQIAASVVGQLKDELKGVSCCPLSSEAKESAVTLFKNFADVGDNNMARGVSRFFSNFYYWARLRKINSKVFDVLIKAGALGALAFILYLMWKTRYLDTVVGG